MAGNTITTLSQLGARLSIAKYHVFALSKSSAKDDSVRHLLYLVDPNNELLSKYVHGLQGKFTVYEKSQNTWTKFEKLKKGMPKFGADINYDFLIRCPETEGIFLTLHDDSIIADAGVWDYIRNILRTHDYGGYLDTRLIPQYENIIFDGLPMSSLRIGTWFCFGRKEHYIKNGYTIGDYHNHLKWLINLEYKTLRLGIKGWKCWLNGGFNLNIKSRLNGDKLFIVDEKEKYAEHMQKITGFFVKRDMLKYADTESEVAVWSDYLKKLKAENPKGFEYDISFLSEIAIKLEECSIFDCLLNSKQIEKFKSF